MAEFWPEPALGFMQAFEKLTFFSMNHTWNLHLMSHTHWIVEWTWLSYILFMNWTLRQDVLHCFVEKSLFSSLVSPPTPTHSEAHGLTTPYRTIHSHRSFCFDPSIGSCLLLPIPFSDKSLLLLLYSYYYFCASHSSGQESFKNLNYFVARHGAIFLKVAFLFWIRFISYSVWFYEFAKSCQVLRNPRTFFSNTHTHTRAHKYI